MGHDMVVRRALLLLAALGLLALAPAAASAQAPCTKDFTGATNANWNVAGNWAPPGVPGATDVVCAGVAATELVVNTTANVRAIRSERPVRTSSSLTLSDAAEPSSFTTLTLGTHLAGAGSLTARTLIWNGGGMSGTGTTTVTERHEFRGSSSALSISNGRRVVTEGTGLWSANAGGTGDVVWTNRAAIVATTGDMGGSANPDGVRPIFRNEAAGSVTRTTSNHNYNFGFLIENDGLLVQPAGEPGTFNLDGTSGVSSGRFEGLALAAEGVVLGEGASLARVNVRGSVRLPDDATVEARDLTVSGGAIEGRATLVLPGHFHAYYGRVGRGGMTMIQPAGATLEWTAAFHLDARRFESAGTSVITATGTGTVNGWGARTVWENTGTIQLVGGQLATVTENDEGGRLINRGTILKTGTATVTVEPQIVNDGLIEIQGGRLAADRLEQTPDGTLRFGISGPALFGGLTGSTLRYSGRLEAVLLGGFVPAAGARFNVVQNTNLDGAFSSTSLSGLTLDVTANAIGLVAPAAPSFAPPGDLGGLPAPGNAAPPLARSGSSAAGPVTRVADRRVRLAAGRTYLLRGRVHVVSRTRGLRVRVDARGAHVRRLAPGTQRLRYRVLDAEGRRSRVATLTVRS